MKLEHEFTVPAPIDEAWNVLLDVERIAPCMPGATLLTVDGDEFTGTVKVKVGPIQVTYKGNARFTERDDAAHRAVIEASGKEARGTGTAAATVHTRLEPAGDAQTKVMVETDLNVTGRPAQFGRGVMSEVGAKIVGQFADRLAKELAGPASAPEPPATAPPLPPSAGAQTEAAPAPATPQATSEPASTQPVSSAPAASAPRAVPTPSRPVEAIDLLDVAGGSVAKRLLPALGVLLVLLVVWRRRRH